MTRAPQPPDFSRYTANFDRGRSLLVELFWILADALLVSSFLPGSAHRRYLLRLFGARIGSGVVIKPGVKVKFPWRLTVGDNSWLGEQVWIDNLAPVAIGPNVSISQGAYLCTGSHDWSTQGFDLLTEAITIGEGAWVGAFARIGPGVSVGTGAVLSLGAVATHDAVAWTVYAGNPAQPKRERTIGPNSGEERE